MRRSVQYLGQNDFEKYPGVNRELWPIIPRMMHYAFFLWCGMALLCGGCYKQSYDEVVPKIEATSNRSIVVATHDQRPYIVSGEAKPEVVGIKRGGFGNPFLVSTASGRPLADDMTQVICNGLQRKGFQCIPVSVMASDSTDIVRRKLKETTTDLALLLTVHQWRSDTYIRTSLEHKTTLEVFDRDGTLLAHTSVQAAKAGDVLPGVTAGVDTTHTSVPLALKSILEELLNYPNVVTALQRS